MPVKHQRLLPKKPKQPCAFKCWCYFLLRIGIGKIYNEEFSKFKQNIFMSDFAQAIQEANLTIRNKYELVEGTVSDTLSYVAQAFRSNYRPDPRLDVHSKTCFIVLEQFRGYCNQYVTKLK